MIQWDRFTSEILNFHKQGLRASEISNELITKHPEIHFPSGTDRRVREIIHRFKISPEETNRNNGGKVLVYDIETHPIKTFTWSMWPDSINNDMIVHDWGILSWSAKWLFEDEIMHDKLTQSELESVVYHDELKDQRVSKSIWSLIDEADVIIHHNGDKFDIQKLNSKWFEYGITPPSPYQSIDTLKHARKKLKGLTSRRLDFIAQKLELDGKMETPKGMWMKIMKEADYESMEHLVRYCDQDVRLLEAVYLKMRPWISPHPNMALTSISDDGCCPVCTGTERKDLGTPYRTYSHEYASYSCLSCGSNYKGRKAISISPPFIHMPR